jgi:acetoin utilization protein AcuB
MLVGQCMNKTVISATSATSHREAVALLREHNIRRLPIIDRGKLVGIVSEKDLLTAQPSPATTLSVYEIFSLLDKLPLKQIMKQPVMTVGPECPVEDAALIMLTRKIGCLPVVENAKVIGIITESDIFRVFVEVLGGNEVGTKFTVQLEDTPGKLAQVCAAVANAGGNILSVTSVRLPNKGVREVTVKQRGALVDDLRDEMRKIGAGILDLHHSQPYTPVMVG